MVLTSYSPLSTVAAIVEQNQAVFEKHENSHHFPRTSHACPAFPRLCCFAQTFGPEVLQLLHAADKGADSIQRPEPPPSVARRATLQSLVSL